MPGSFFDEAHAVAYWQRLKRNDLTNAYRYTSIVGLYARDNENEETAYGFNGHVIKNFNTGMLTHKVIAGTELRMSSLEQYSAGSDACPTGRRAASTRAPSRPATTSPPTSPSSPRSMGASPASTSRTRSACCRTACASPRPALRLV